MILGSRWQVATGCFWLSRYWSTILLLFGLDLQNDNDVIDSFLPHVWLVDVAACMSNIYRGLRQCSLNAADVRKAGLTNVTDTLPDSTQASTPAEPEGWVLKLCLKLYENDLVFISDRLSILFKKSLSKSNQIKIRKILKTCFLNSRVINTL